MDRPRTAILLLGTSITCIVAGLGIIILGIIQQYSLPPYMRARVWADGWKSEKEVREEAQEKAKLSGAGLLGASMAAEEAADQMNSNMPKSGLTATRTLIGSGATLLALGSGLLASCWVDGRRRGKHINIQREDMPSQG